MSTNLKLTIKENKELHEQNKRFKSVVIKLKTKLINSGDSSAKNEYFEK